MNFVIVLFPIFWLTKEIRAWLFWLYLWQLKEYRIKRFIDHLRTEKGRRIFKNPLFLFKLLLCVALLFHWKVFYLFWMIFLIFFLEFCKTLWDFFSKKILTPVFTKKAIFLSFFALLLLLFLCNYFIRAFPFNFFFWFLFFDVLNFLFFSLLVLIFQPLSIFYKHFLALKAKQKRMSFQNLLVIGITGSYGKTSTKEFLATILETKFPGKILKTKEHQNTEFAIFQTILSDLKREHQIFICEMGAYEKGEIDFIAKVIQPQIGIITGVNEQHLALFGSMENLISAEGGKELIENLPPDGLVIFNGENQILREIFSQTKQRKKIVGIEKEDFDLWAKNIKVDKTKISFEIVTKEKESAKIEANLIGAQNVQNLLLAACCAKELGMELGEIAKAIQKITQEQSGVKFIHKNGFNFIDATYSANPDSVLSHLEYLKVWPGKKAVIMPCLIELGEKSSQIHQKIGQKIYQICHLAIIVTKDKFKDIKKYAREKVKFLEDPKKILKEIENFKGENDVILLEGRIPSSLKRLLFDNGGSRN